MIVAKLANHANENLLFFWKVAIDFINVVIVRNPFIYIIDAANSQRGVFVIIAIAVEEGSDDIVTVGRSAESLKKRYHCRLFANQDDALGVLVVGASMLQKLSDDDSFCCEKEEEQRYSR